MIEKTTVISSWAKRCLPLGVVFLLAIVGTHCDSTTSPAAPAVQLLAPVAGSTFKLTDTINLIVQIDTNQYHRKALYFSFSTDTGACWAVDCGAGGQLQTYLKVTGNKGAVRRDTVRWAPSDPFLPVAIPAGQTVHAEIKVFDYAPSTITETSGLFSISN